MEPAFEFCKWSIHSTSSASFDVVAQAQSRYVCTCEWITCHEVASIPQKKGTITSPGRSATPVQWQSHTLVALLGHQEPDDQFREGVTEACQS